MEMGELSSAKNDFTQAVKMRPEFPMAYLERGRIYHHEEGKLKEAILDYSLALKYRSNYLPAILERGDAYYSARSYSKALEDLQRAVDLDTKLLQNPTVQYKLGWANLHTSTPSRARPHFQEAKKISVENMPEVSLGLGYCDMFDGNTDTGLALMEEAFQSGQFGKKEILKNPLTKTIKRNKRFKALVKSYLN